MSYTNQEVIWEPCYKHSNKEAIVEYLNDEDNEQLISAHGELLEASENVEKLYIEDSYNDIEYNKKYLIKARKQPHEEVLQTKNGNTVLTKSIFYVDPVVEPNAMKIGHMDKLDNETVEQIYIMMTRNGKPKMIRFITV